MKKVALVIMAAGIGSRFGGGIKQLEPVGPNGEIIMDYSIYDAMEAGFNKVVFVIRKDLEKDFKEIIGQRIESCDHIRTVTGIVDRVVKICSGSLVLEHIGLSHRADSPDSGNYGPFVIFSAGKAVNVHTVACRSGDSTGFDGCSFCF